MNLPKKIAHFLALIFLATFLLSCTESCVEPDEFDSQSIVIASKPLEIFGTYDPVSGGQRVNWNDPSLRSNGTEFLMQITGSWTSLNGNAETFNKLPRCDNCAKKEGVANCICYEGQIPTAEKDPAGNLYTEDRDGKKLDCASNASHQDDATRCTCTKQNGKATGYDIYHFPRNLLEKDGATVKKADQQTDCKYDRGMGAYMSLWGNKGVTTPIRSYHLFSEETICNVLRSSNGQCVDKSGNDMTRYVFRSANNRIFMKDDHDGNDGPDNNTGNDEYHTSNEYLKVTMYDRYYRDNYGSYNIQILRGVGNSKENGLLESLVSVVEDALLGKLDDDGNRDGGIIRFMYLAVVQDSGFSLAMQMSLIFYVTLFGAAHIWGLVEMNKKEITGRMLKIALIMFFVSPTSWNAYNQFIVGFFIDGMNYVIGIFMSLSDSSIEQTSMIKIAQMDRVAEESSATRFAYVDLIIKKLMSEATAKKIAALFFSDFFGFFYMIMIYAVIFMFIAVMLFIATIYITNLIKLIFVLSIGPIFIVFTLFTKTAGYFNNWIGYVAGRSFEMIVLFIVLYLFVTIIDKNFTEMLLYRVCPLGWRIGTMSMTILKTVNFERSFPEWLTFFAAIAGLLFVMYDLIDKLPNVVAALFSLKIGGNAASSGIAKDAAGAAVPYSGMGAATAYGGAAGFAGEVFNRTAAPLTSMAMYGMGRISDKIGLSSIRDGILSGLPNNPIGQSIMGEAMKSAASAGEGKSGAAKEEAMRSAFSSAMQSRMLAEPLKMSALGISDQSIGAFMEQKLVKEPLRDFLKQEAKNMRNMGDKTPIGQADIAAHLASKASAWAQKNLSATSAERVKGYLGEKGIKDLMTKHGSMTAAEAAKAFANNPDKQNEFRAHLAGRQAEEKLNYDKAKGSLIGLASRGLSNIKHAYTNSPHHNPGRMQRSFERELDSKKNLKPLSDDDYKIRTDNARIEGMLSQLQNQKTPQDLNSAKNNTERKQMIKDNKREAQKQDFFLKKLRDNAKSAKDTRGLREQMYDRAAAVYNRDKDNVRRTGNATSERNKLLKDLQTNDVKNLSKKAAELSKFNERLGIKFTKDPQLELIEMQRKAKNDSELSKEFAEKMLAHERAASLLKDGDALSKAEAFQKKVDNGLSATTLEEKKVATGLVATSFEITFGASISDALMKSPNILLEAGNILLEAPKNKDGVVDEKVVAALEVNSHQADSQLKMVKLDKQIKQMEIEQATAAGNLQELSKLKDEMKKLEKSFLGIEGNCISLAAQLKSLKP
jgi:type IV secretory pathway VirB6-like protein